MDTAVLWGSGRITSLDAPDLIMDLEVAVRF